MIVLAISLNPFSQQLLQLQQGTKFVKATPAWHTDPGSAFTKVANDYRRGDVIIANTKNSTQNPDSSQVHTVTTRLDLSAQTAILNGLSHS